MISTYQTNRYKKIGPIQALEPVACEKLELPWEESSCYVVGICELRASGSSWGNLNVACWPALEVPKNIYVGVHASL